MNRRSHAAWVLNAVLAVVGMGLFLVQPGVLYAELNGDCKIEGRLNPGLGCSSASKGNPCTINGVAGTCTNMKRPIESLYYCVCLPASEKVPEEVEAKAVATAHINRRCGETVTFNVDTSSPQIIDSVLPKSLGDQVVRLQSFSGTFTISTYPIDGQPDVCRLVIEEGTFTAPAFLLIDKTSTGPNTYRFSTPDTSGGTLDLRTGAYKAFARGAITNSRFPEIPTSGTYRGTVNFDTGTITIDSTTLDTVSEDVVPALVELPKSDS